MTMLILRSEQDFTSINQTRLTLNHKCNVRYSCRNHEDTTVPSRIRTAFSETALVHTKV